VAALVVSHSAPDALRKKGKLIVGWRFARPSIVVGSPGDSRTSLTNELLFYFRPRVYPRPSIFRVPPVFSQSRELFRRNVTLSAPALWALKNIMDKARLRHFFARESHLSIAFNAERIVSKRLDHAAIQAKKGRILSNMRQPQSSVSATRHSTKAISRVSPRVTKCQSDLFSISQQCYGWVAIFKFDPREIA
jgi:hypothetical protein